MSDSELWTDELIKSVLYPLHFPFYKTLRKTEAIGTQILYYENTPTG